MTIFPTSFQRDLIKRFIGPFLFCFSVIIAILVMQFLILFTDRLVGKDLPIRSIIELIFSNLASLIILAVPMSILAASLLVYGKISETNEFTAIRAAGIHPWRVFAPLFWVSVLLFGSMVYFADNILPRANLDAKRLWTEIRLIRPAFDLQPGVFYEGIDGYTFLARSIDTSTDTMYQITLYRDQGNSGRAVFRAEKAHLKTEANLQTMHLQLYQGSVTRWLPQTDAERFLEQSHFGSYSIRFDISNINPTSNTDESKNDRSMNIAELETLIDSLFIDIQNQKAAFSKKENLQLNKLLKSGTDQSSASSILSPTAEYEVPDYIGQNLSNTPYYILRSAYIEPFDRLSAMRSSIQTLRSSQLDFENLELNVRWRNERIAEYQVEIYKKFAIPFVCLVFFFCGAGIGLISKRGNLGFAAIMSAIISTVYWISIIQGEKWADRLVIPTWLGMWAGNIMLAIVALLLILKVFSDRFFYFSFRRSNNV
jgi:lipopolysaccharide export system permease protein